MNAITEFTPLMDAVVSHIDEGVILADNLGNVVYHNPAAANMLGIEDVDTISSIKPDTQQRSLSSPLYRLPAKQRLDAIVNATQVKQQFEQRLVNHGVTRFVEFNSTTVTIPGEPSPYHLLVMHDITEKRKLEAIFHDNIDAGLITQDPAMLEISTTIEHVAPTSASVLLQGESGTGKTLLARMIHNKSQRADKPFIEVNCAAIPEALIESELFGHVKGAFTGAVNARLGRMQAANGGTLFLDEISEIPLHLQPKLLKAIEEQRFQMVGSDNDVKVDTRIIAASNQNLRAMIDDGNFRSDLFYRLAVIAVDIPALRDRRGDIPLLIRHICDSLVKRGYPSEVECDQDSMAMMLDYHWPGNVRELSNAIEHAMLMARNNLVTPICLPHDIRLHWSRRQEQYGGGSELDSQRQEILDALNLAGGNRAEAARILGIDRSTLWRRMHRLGLADNGMSG